MEDCRTVGSDPGVVKPNVSSDDTDAELCETEREARRSKQGTVTLTRGHYERLAQRGVTEKKIARFVEEDCISLILQRLSEVSSPHESLSTILAHLETLARPAYRKNKPRSVMANQSAKAQVVHAIVRPDLSLHASLPVNMTKRRAVLKRTKNRLRNQRRKDKRSGKPVPAANTKPPVFIIGAAAWGPMKGNRRTPSPVSPRVSLARASS